MSAGILKTWCADYEVDFITFFTKLTSVGATFNPDMYLKPLAINPIRF